jgi:hypothetical protein
MSIWDAIRETLEADGRGSAGLVIQHFKESEVDRPKSKYSHEQRARRPKEPKNEG